MKINCIIIEDEPLALERIKNFVAKLSFLTLTGEFDSGLDALVFLKSNPVDLLFLDININEISGIRLLETANIKSQVIISTAYHEYAIKAFELDVTDYLLKPYTFERFAQAIDRAREKFEKDDPIPARNFIFIKTEYRLEKLALSDILYIEGMRDYRKIVTTGRQIMTLQNFKDLEQEIPASIICRVHKSYMVSLDKIDAVEKERIRIGDKIIPLSDTYKKIFFELIRH